jgi:thiol:disulfide interchange protein
MINTNFNILFQINRTKLFQLLLDNNIDVSFDPIIHACVNIKYHLANNKNKTISVFVFESGSITIAGSNSSDEEVQAKPKRERTEKQKLAFEKAQQTRMLKAEQRRKERMQKEVEEKKELEQKLIQKAIAVKKKQIKKMKVIEELSDDDTPIEKKTILKKPVSEPIEIPKLRFLK